MNKLHANEFLKIEILAEEFINRINDTGIPLFAFIELISLLAASSLKIHNEVNFKEFDKDFISLCKKYNNICKHFA